ncbi:tetratricopeptide repeat protein [Oceaniovalibus guishaninsula]|nr:tetratricopeptide repeat protein [Oceaniovalibus guishaninsula]
MSFFLPPRPLLGAVLAASLALTACESSADKAERFYQSGMALLEAGDTDRAMVEFRNVFRFDGAHQDARRQLARILLERGDISRAYSEYLRLAEQYPDTPDIRRALARIAIEQGQWAEAERHGRAALSLDPDHPEARVIGLALDFRKAVEDEDAAERVILADTARDILNENPDEIVAQRVLLAQLLDTEQLTEALELLNGALETDPTVLEFNVLKFQLLVGLGDTDAADAQLRRMYELFPDNEEVQQTLIAWFLDREDFDSAESFLRDRAGGDTSEPEKHAPVIALIEQARGREAATAEVDRLIAANAGNPANIAAYRAVKATYAFQDGDRTQAIAELQDVLADAEPSDQTRRIKAMLAQMLLTTDNQVGARALVEEILTEDPANVPALKLRGAMLIEADEPDAAIIDLRRALDQNPRDTGTILLLADAHARGGDTDLQGERLATAVEVSGSGPDESLRYAAFLVDQGRLAPARSVLADARRANPGNIDILLQSARLALEEGSEGLVRGIIGDLQLLDDPRAARGARSLETALLLQADRVEDGLAMLEEQAGSDGGNIQAVIAVVETQLRNGRTEEARRYLDTLLVQSPDDPGLRQVDASLAAAEGDVERAESILRDLVAADPAAEAPAQQLYRLLNATARPDEAEAVLDAAIAAQPESRLLRLFKAGELERDGRFDDAIAIYEDLYAQNSGDVVVANNLASMLSTHRQTDESLARATAVARRLRGTDVPPFQDTYGWIAYRDGRFDEALDYLEPAAAGLPQDPLVQYHLGMTYAALGRDAEAAETLRRTLDMAGDSPLPQFETARETLAALSAAPDSDGPDSDGADSDIPAAADTAPDPDAGPGTADPVSAPDR